MNYTRKFRDQHAELLMLAGELTQQLTDAAEAQALRTQLSKLAGKLNFHLAMEDEALYPRLMAASDSTAKALATRFRQEMGGLGQVFQAYNAKWQASAIRNDREGFAAETQKVFAALAQRIARENRELYPAADQLA